MRIVYKSLVGNGGALTSVKVLLRAMLVEFPEDTITIVCAHDSDLVSLSELPNANLVLVRGGAFKEISRSYLETVGIRRIAKSNRADVVWSANVGPYIRTGIPQVLSVTNPHQVYPWHYSRYHPRSRFTVAMLRVLFRRSLRCCDAVHVQMPLTGEYVRRIRNAPKNIVAIPKAVESEADFQPQPLSIEMQKRLDSGLGRAAFSFLFVATYLPHKNHVTVIKAIDRLSSQGADVRLVLTIDEETLCQKVSRGLVAKLVESGHLVSLGWVGKRQLSSLYHACDACVMPSVLESLSSAHLEAMQWQRPQICADLPYARDLCGDAAIYADSEDPHDWVEKMRSLMEDSAQRESLVTAGLVRMQSFPQTWQDVARKVRHFLAEVAEGKVRSAE